jgi:nucleotide-binding universal stress UspA family protein
VKLERILIAVDGSPAGHRAVEVGLELAAASAGEVVLFHASRDHAYRLFEENAEGADSDERIMEEVPALAEAASAAAERGVEPRLVLVGDDASAAEIASVMLGRAEGEGAGLIVVGSRGHGAVVGKLLGSVSQALLEQAELPVVVVHAARSGGEDDD